MSSTEDLKEFLNSTHPTFVSDFESLLKMISYRCPEKDHKSLTSVWAQYNALLALTEKFASRADAASEEMSRLVQSEVSSKIENL